MVRLYLQHQDRTLSDAPSWLLVAIHWTVRLPDRLLQRLIHRLLFRHPKRLDLGAVLSRGRVSLVRDRFRCWSKSWCSGSLCALSMSTGWNQPNTWAACRSVETFLLGIYSWGTWQLLDPPIGASQWLSRAKPTLANDESRSRSYFAARKSALLSKNSWAPYWGRGRRKWGKVPAQAQI